MDTKSSDADQAKTPPVAYYYRIVCTYPCSKDQSTYALDRELDVPLNTIAALRAFEDNWCRTFGEPIKIINIIPLRG